MRKAEAPSRHCSILYPKQHPSHSTRHSLQPRFYPLTLWSTLKHPFIFPDMPCPILSHTMSSFATSHSMWFLAFWKVHFETPGLAPNCPFGLSHRPSVLGPLGQLPLNALEWLFLLLVLWGSLSPMWGITVTCGRVVKLSSLFFPGLLLWTMNPFYLL